MNYLPIHGKRLYDAIELYQIKGGRYTKQELSRKLNRCNSYLAARIREGSMRPNDLENLCVLIKREPDEFYSDLPEGYSPSGMPPRAYLKEKYRHKEDPQVSLFDLIDSGDILSKFNEVLDLQRQIDMKLLEITKELYKRKGGKL